jgi:preprotein translocase subunit SecE
MAFTDKGKAFFKEVYVELRKTSWLSRREILRYTLIVLGVTVVVAVFLGGLDYLFSTALKSFLLR